MLYANDNLATLTGAVLNVKPNCDPSLAQTFINQRLRSLLDMRVFWAGGTQRGVVSVPQSYNVGNITTALGSNVVTGVGTSWPVNDIVSTSLTSNIRQPGLQVVSPASMQNISVDTWLYVGAGGPKPEVVYVLSTTPTTFTASFSYPHNTAETITCSSFAGRTMRFGFQIPNYLITAIVDPSTLLIEFPFAGTALTNVSYTILKNLYIFAPRLKALLSVVDPYQATELITNYPIQNLNAEDPQRTSIDFPRVVATHSISPAGSALFEVWPSPTQARQLYFEYYAQPEDLVAPGDRPPAYLNPQVIVMGAIADALRTKIGVDSAAPDSAMDPYYDPAVADIWEQRFAQGAENLCNADNNLYNQQYTWRKTQFGFPSGANWARSHDWDAFMGNW